MAKDNNQCGVGVAYNSNLGCKYCTHSYNCVIIQLSLSLTTYSV